RAIYLLELYGLHLAEEHNKLITDKIWELRIDRYRVLYFLYDDRQFIMVRAFMKKTAKTPAREIRIAEKRYLDYISRSEGA
ncbi:MAG: type II toxin-antitoxin system RelE/ParE family toxin, partial [Dehalococcoidales bacterium]|nr:type II toxin-antitoxin system RelE/ParE family toxin [Dehalococcoidales bacterium]